MRSFQNNLSYILIGLASALAVFLFAIWLPNFSLLKHVAVTPEFSVSAKLNLFIATLGSFKSALTLFSQISVIIISVLFGINFSLLIFYFKKKFDLDKSMGLSFAGILLGLIGVGCASCGSVILMAFFGLTATAAFVAVLPLHGQEFGIISIIILLMSVYLISKKIKEPLVCK